MTGEIRNKHFRNTSREHYHCSNPLGGEEKETKNRSRRVEGGGIREGEGGKGEEKEDR
jgi:hypothetical protein